MLVDCDGNLPERLLRQSWQRVEARKAHLAFQAIDRLVRKLTDILRADDANSATGLNAESLRASFGTSFAADFDFGAMSGLLATPRAASTLPPRRRARVTHLLQVLQGQRLFPVPAAHSGSATEEVAPYPFVFSSCDEAVRAYYARLPELSELAKAMLMADLEVDGAYREEVHDRLFEDGLGAAGAASSELSQFPSYLVVVKASHLTGAESGALIEALARGLPIKVLLQTDDLGGEAAAGNGQAAAGNGQMAGGLEVQQLTRAALGLGDVYVLQSASSHLYRVQDRIRRAMGYSGPALVGVYSGAGGWMGDLPPYLAAAAAMESRAFPAFAYDPTAGPDWASRCHVTDNPRPELDWTVHELDYEDDDLQRRRQAVAFTAADFLACDGRNAAHLARVPADKWDDSMVPVAELLSTTTEGMPQQVPYLLMVDPEGGLHRVLVGRQLEERARRHQARWHELRELGGVRNSIAERRVAEARALWEAEREAEREVASATALLEPADEAAVAEPEAGETPAAKPARSPDEAWIETARCSSCNECILINDRMFKYNQNKQAVIAD